jgi:hypothetical protein
MTVIKQFKRDDDFNLRAILVTVVPAGAMYENGVAYHPNGSIYMILS